MVHITLLDTLVWGSCWKTTVPKELFAIQFINPIGYTRSNEEGKNTYTKGIMMFFFFSFQFHKPSGNVWAKESCIYLMILANNRMGKYWIHKRKEVILLQAYDIQPYSTYFWCTKTRIVEVHCPKMMEARSDSNQKPCIVHKIKLDWIMHPIFRTPQQGHHETASLCPYHSNGGKNHHTPPAAFTCKWQHSGHLFAHFLIVVISPFLKIWLLTPNFESHHAALGNCQQNALYIQHIYPHSIPCS
jgi:hypothetical protein